MGWMTARKNCKPDASPRLPDFKEGGEDVGDILNYYMAQSSNVVSALKTT